MSKMITICIDPEKNDSVYLRTETGKLKRFDSVLECLHELKRTGRIGARPCEVYGGVQTRVVNKDGIGLDTNFRPSGIQTR